MFPLGNIHSLEPAVVPWMLHSDRVLPVPLGAVDDAFEVGQFPRRECLGFIPLQHEIQRCRFRDARIEQPGRNQKRRVVAVLPLMGFRRVLDEPSGKLHRVVVFLD